MSDDHNIFSDCRRDLQKMRTIPLSLLNRRVFYSGQWINIVYIQDQIVEIRGYYLLIPDDNELCFNLIMLLSPS